MPRSSMPEVFQSPTTGIHCNPSPEIFFFCQGFRQGSMLQPLFALARLLFKRHSWVVVSNRPILAGRWSKLAVHVALPLTGTTPLLKSGSPLQPVNVEPKTGITRSDTRVGAAKIAEQSVTQSSDPGLPTTCPLPLPVKRTF